MKNLLARTITLLLLLFPFNTFANPSLEFSPSSSSRVAQDANKNQLKDDQKKLSARQLSAEMPKDCMYWLPLFRPFCYRLHQIWIEGHNELYISGYTWHNRFTYSEAYLRQRKYNELAWGGGFGKGFFDEHGNWHGLYAFAFLDSHSKVEPIAGYAYLIVANLVKDFKAGLGFSLFVTARSDIIHYAPFPGAAPWVGVFYKKVSLKAAYVPGSSTNGNVLFVVGTYSFD